MVRELKGSRSSKEASVVLSSVVVEARQLDADGTPVGDVVTLGSLAIDTSSGLVSLDAPVDGVTPADGWQVLLRERGRDSQTTAVKVFFASEPVVVPDPDPVPDPEPDPTPDPDPVPDPTPTTWPAAGTVGYLGSIADLTPTRGRTIRTAGTVIEGEYIDTSDGALVIDAPDVTIRNCVFTVGIWGVDALDGATNLVVEDSTFHGGYQAAIGLSQAQNWRISRCDFSEGRDAIKPGGSGVVEDCRMHDPDTGGDAHNDCLQFSDVDGVTVRRCHLAGADTSCIAMFENQATYRNVTIEGNYLGGAGYAIYAGGSTGTNIRIRNNTFGDYGYQHPVTDWAPKTGHEFTGNVYTDGMPVLEP